MKEKTITILFIVYISLFGISHIILKDNKISITERRNLTTLKEIKFENNFITKLDKYILDQFPLRNEFRNIKANFNYKLLNKLENNNIYLEDKYIFKSDYPTNIKSINNFKEKIENLINLLTKENKTYIMIIPDKNYYSKSKNILNIDYNYIYEEIDKINIEKIDIKNIMNINDYYETDTHWKQENLNKVILKMSEIIGLNYKEELYKQNLYMNFYGVYSKESGINRKPEKLTYLTNKVIENAKVKYLENKNLSKVYNIEKLKSLDSYEVYLDGASSFIEITNENVKEKKELVIFRDSFASSLTPLLINYYSKITLIDNRYINSENIKKYIEFNNQDVIFMYSTLIINNSFSLKG